MCGISGIVARDGRARADAIERQLRRLRHRGPDAAGQFAVGRGAVAQNRLAVIDLETGDPPMTDETGTIGAVLNGEIYNFRELRDELLAHGHRLRSRGDTEVIAHLAEDLGAAELARRLDGMFAFAIWDARRRRLLLGRDRLGKKPLYYYCDGDRLVFGSEIKALFADPSVPRELNPRAVPAYLTFGYVPTPETFFRGVFSLPPAHVLTLAPDSEPAIERYWELPVAGVGGIGPLEVGLEEAAGLVRDSLLRAVERRLVADVPLGAFLSGGVDSSAIVALMASVSDRPVKTFTIGFEQGQGFDERPYARRVARLYGTEHHEHVAAPDAVELLETLLWHHDQPFGDSSAIPTYLVNELTRADVTVALSGDGGDELFAGYERFAAGLALASYGRLPGGLRRTLRAAAGPLPPDGLARRAESAQRFLAAGELAPLDAYRATVSFFDERARADAIGGPAPDDWALRDYAAAWERTAGAEPLDRLLALNVHTYLLDDLLVKADRMSMAHALEVRSPFLDTELIELAFRLPPRLKLGHGRRKRVLAAAVADLLPADILRRRKRGFAVPLDHWFRNDLRAYLLATLGGRDGSVRAHLAPAAIDRLLDEHDAGRRNHGQRLWLLLTLELFLRHEGW
jgi:asparagine synthase (glutamine-hydrolysing)